MNEHVVRPSVLRSVDAPKAWGWELWLTSTRPPAEAFLEGGRTLADLVDAHPNVLGHWTRRLFGDHAPIFTKLIHTDFPSHVHLGFRKSVEREQLLGWLELEQQRLVQLVSNLTLSNEQAFHSFQERYSAWAIRQALSAWRRDDDEASAHELAPFVDSAFDLTTWLRALRANRALIVDTLNELDLAKETGNLLLTSAGVMHAIFGLSHQTHPHDHSRSALETLFGSLAEQASRGAPDDELTRLIDAADLGSLRSQNRAPPKNEAWFPTLVDGIDVLVEPQQTSDTTYSLADFYTPFTWTGGRLTFRKGSKDHGLSREELTRYLAEVDMSVTSLDSVRRSPKWVEGVSKKGAELFRLLDEPTSWPYFTAYQLELEGTFTARPPEGVYQELVVSKGTVELSDRSGIVGELSSRVPGFVPATLHGEYTLRASAPATVMIFSVPGARGGAPRVV